jgi:hypothetical protein
MRLYDKDEPHTALGEQVTYRSGIVERDIYCTAMYFVTSSITTVGYGDIAGLTEGEKIFIIFL